LKFNETDCGVIMSKLVMQTKARIQVEEDRGDLYMMLLLYQVARMLSLDDIDGAALLLSEIDFTTN